MAAVSRQLVEAVKDELNDAPDGTFSRAFTALRDYLVQTRLEEIGNLRVVVFAADQEQEIETRGTDRREQQVDVGVQQKLSGTDPENVDPLVDLTEEIADHLNRRKLAGFAGAHWLSNEILTAGLRDHLVRQSVYTGVVRVTYRVIK